MSGSCGRDSAGHASTGPTLEDRGPQDLRTRERVRGHLRLSAASAGCRRTRSRATCSAASSPGAAAATSSCATAPGSISTSAATPNTRLPSAIRSIDLVAHDKAGERILEGLLVEAERRLREEGIAGDVHLFKNNTDSAGNSYGCHENYLVGRHGEFSRLADVLVPFLVTRQVICGAGKVLQTPRGAVYCISQRAEHIWESVSSATTRSRPIINTRDEPHADAERFRRLHVIVGDSNMSETTTLLKVGSTDLVLRMIEAGVVMRDLTLENPIRAIREVSHDITCQRKVKLANGREATALEIQREYHKKAADFIDRRGGDAVAKQVIDLWGRTLEAVETQNFGLVDREIDWITKYTLIDRFRARHELPLSSPRVAEVDLKYHDIHRERGLYYKLERAGAVDAGLP